MSILISTLLERMGDIPVPTEGELTRLIDRNSNCDSEITSILGFSARPQETEEKKRQKAIEECRKSFRIEYWERLFAIDFPTAALFNALVEPVDTVSSMITKLQGQMPDHPAAPITIPDLNARADDVPPGMLDLAGEMFRDEFARLRHSVDNETRTALIDLISKLRDMDAQE